ncbi:MAG TPA: DNA-binding protein [Candidatus Bathyarchaeota archaeon]|nr:DNA-binding protein [Candidatus Bathyarchaeota archaeon]HEX69097.1 DNA-binding protein [Candidatus Bathyarchaeota archaeon]
MGQIKKLRDVRPGAENLNLVVRVVSVGKPRKILTRYGEAVTALAVVEDETGRLNLKLWRSQVNLVKPGDIIKIENGFAVQFGGATEINVGSRGRIIVVKRLTN